MLPLSYSLLPSFVWSTDETSSGVASLEGNENSRDPWDIDVDCCNTSAANLTSSLPQLSGQDVSDQNDLESSCLGVIKVQEFTDLEIQSTLLNDTRIVGESPLTELAEEVKTEDQVPVLLGSQLTELDEEVKKEELEVLGNQFIEQTISLTGTECKEEGDETSTNSVAPGTSNSSPPESAQLSSKNGIFLQNRVSSQSPVVSSTAARNASRTLQETSVSSPYIPRLIDGSVKDGSKVQPKLWTPHDVAMFLRTNDCGAYCDNFILQVSKYS